MNRYNLNVIFVIFFFYTSYRYTLLFFLIFCVFLFLAFNLINYQCIILIPISVHNGSLCVLYSMIHHH